MKKLLIANRGEIVVRIARSARDMGIKTVAVYSEADKNAPHVREADESYFIGGSRPLESYLNIDAIIKAAKETGADAIHPGYGFISEKEAFARAVVENGITWVGPSPDILKNIESKCYCRDLSHRVDVPVIPGTIGVVHDEADIHKLFKELGPPLLLKLDKGGGGRGIQAITRERDISKVLKNSQSMGKVAFDCPDCYVEKKMEHIRHIEVQFLGDRYGNYVTLWERECSMQRRYQKLVEESPSPVVTPEERRMLSEWTVRLAKEMGYENAGTIEYLRAEDGKYYFIEVNARIQVEHPVTEFITDVDIVKEQLRIASGQPLGVSQKYVIMEGHSIQARIYAEDPESFMPSPGAINKIVFPEIKQIKTRLEHAIEEGVHITHFYDPLLAKVIVWGSTRAKAIDRLKRRLDELQIQGVQTNLPLIKMIIDSDEFNSGNFNTDSLPELLKTRAIHRYGM